MRVSEIHAEQHYTVIIGGIPFTGRVDAIDQTRYGVEFITYIEEMGEWKRLSPSRFAGKSLSHAQQFAKVRRYIANLPTCTPQVARPPLNQPWPAHQEAIIYRQGTYFPAGDFGMTRET